jgi:hypothetical protein
MNINSERQYEYRVKMARYQPGRDAFFGRLEGPKPALSIYSSFYVSTREAASYKITTFSDESASALAVARRALPAGRLTFGTEASSFENAILVRGPRRGRGSVHARRKSRRIHKAGAKVPAEIAITFLRYYCTNGR